MPKPARLKYCFCVCAFFVLGGSVAQNKKYFIEFTDKSNTPYSVSRPAEYLSPRALERRVRQQITVQDRDLPVNPSYLQAVRQTGAKVWYPSRWMNGALIEAGTATLAAVRQLLFVKPLTDQNRLTATVLHKAGFGRHKSAMAAARQQNALAIDYGNSLAQSQMLGIPQMHAAGFTGKGMHIAVLDGGFQSADRMEVFKPLFENRQVLGTHDFVRNEAAVYEDDRHGSQVLSVMAGYQPGALVGPAYGASFWLLRTEDYDTEYRVEEVNWLMAAEFADSAGVDIINTSLGYTDFDDPTMDYRPQDMDGKTAFVTRAANLAAATGMLVVVSAGNEGNNTWQTLSAPADAGSVLAVAAVDKFGSRAGLSSLGRIVSPGTIKPNLAAQGLGTVVYNPPNALGASSGTSFSAPLIAGLAAGLWQAYPQLTNMQVIDYLQRSGSQATKPDTLLGYGIPDFSRASELVRKETDAEATLGYVSPNPLAGYELTLRLNPAHRQEPLTVVFFDLQGRKIVSFEIAKPASDNRLPLNPGLFKPGMYLVRVSSPTAQVTLRLVKL